MTIAAFTLPLLIPQIGSNRFNSVSASSRRIRVHRVLPPRWSAVNAPLPTTTQSPNRNENQIPSHVVAFLQRAKEGNPLSGLEFAEKAFDNWKAGKRIVKPIVFDERHVPDETTPPSFDVIIAGGTLGIFYATALAARGRRVAVVERGNVMGRKQEWNISREELAALVKENVLTQEQVDAAIVNEFPDGSRIAFPDKQTNKLDEIIVRGVLDLGVDPSMLVASSRERFIQFGGTIFEQSTLERVGLRQNSVHLSLVNRTGIVGGDGALGAGGTGLSGNRSKNEPIQRMVLRTRLLVDAMGNFSPIAAQSRDGQAPDGVCITVGACLSGDVGDNMQSDLLCAVDGVNKQSDVMSFWEAFPAGRERDRRTTYMFNYGSCDKDRQTLTSALDDYVREMPRYQGIDIDKVEVERVLFGFFPCFRDSPSPIVFDRVLPVGDAAGLQSPVSFGGFAACMRHLGRISGAVDEALGDTNDELLNKKELQRLQFYNPSLSAAWLFHSFMAVRKDLVGRTDWNRNYINEVLLSTMKAMDRLGPGVMNPFLQDVVRAGGLISTLGLMMARDPVLAVRTAGLGTIGDLSNFFRHLVALMFYTLLAPVVCGLKGLLAGAELSQATRFRLNRLDDALKYGSGLDQKK